MKKDDKDMFPQNNVVGGVSSPKVRKKASNLSNNNANTTKHGTDDESGHLSSNDVIDMPDFNTDNISNTINSDDTNNSSSNSKIDDNTDLSISSLDENVSKNSNSTEDGVFENNSGNDDNNSTNNNTNSNDDVNPKNTDNNLNEDDGTGDNTTDNDISSKNDDNTDDTMDYKDDDNCDDNDDCDLNDCYYDNYSSSCNLDLVVLNEVSKACQTAMNNISYLVKSICNDKMKKELVSMYSQYSNILFQINQHFEKYGEVPDCVSIGCKLMGFCGIKMNTFKNKTSSHVADIMIQGTLLGVIKCQKILNCQLNIDESTTNLLKDFNKFQRDNIDKLNAYL